MHSYYAGMTSDVDMVGEYFFENCVLQLELIALARHPSCCRMDEGKQ